MGSWIFEEEGWMTRKKYDEYDRSDIEPLFSELSEEAGAARPPRGLGLQGDFVQCGVMTRRQYRQGREWLDYWLTRDKIFPPNAPPRLLRDRGLVGRWERAVEDAGAPACAVVIKNEKRPATLVTGKFIKDKGYLPPDEREEKRYAVPYGCEGEFEATRRERRFDNMTDAWDWARQWLAEHPEGKLDDVTYSYTYASPELGEKTRQGQEVKVVFFGKGDRG
jgi:hypothetical protein